MTKTRKTTIVQRDDHREGDDQDQEGGGKGQGNNPKEGDNQDQKKGVSLRKQSLGKGWPKPWKGQ